MDSQDFNAFQEKLSEMKQIFLRELPMSDAVVQHLWRVAKPFDLATVLQACDDLIDTGEFFPKPAELKRACQRYGEGAPGELSMRCLHVDYTRPATPDDTFERHWRCPAIFPADSDQRYCPAHRHLYAEPSKRATDEEISEVFADLLAQQPDSDFLRSVVADRAKRLAAGESVVGASVQALLSAIGKTMPDASDSLDVIQARKRDQLERARGAGLLPEQ